MLISPLAGLLFGMLITYLNNFPINIFTSNFVAIALGMPLAMLIGSRIQEIPSYLLLMAGLLLMSLSLFSESTEGVNRWVHIGSISLNIAMITTPLFLYIITNVLDHKKRLVFTLSLLFIFILQPDAGQATAFSAASILIFLFNKKSSSSFRYISSMIFILAAVIAWYQPDTLPAVMQVESIVQLALNMGVWGIVGLALAIGILIAPILFRILSKELTVNDEDYLLSLACIVYFVTQIVVTGIGNFPVPIMGAGAAPMLGWYLILGMTSIKQIGWTKRSATQQSIFNRSPLA